MRRRGPGPGRMAAGGGPGRRRGRRRAVMMAARMMRRRRRRRVLLVGGLVAFGAYKLSKKDADRVEEHTGKSAEDLSDEELEQAMDDLNIPKEEMTDEEWAEVEQADAGEDDYIEELERLADLRDKGIITDEEFETKKGQLLGL